MAENQNIDELKKQFSRQLNLSEGQLENAAKKGDISSILKNTDKKTAAMAQDILNDPQKTKELLESPQAKAILKMLGKG